MSERLKELVLKTSEARASVGSNPTLSATISYDLRKYPRGRRGSPAKGVGCLINAARVQIPPSAPRRSKVRFAPTPFYACGKKDVIRPLPCSSFPTATRCAGLAVGGPPCGRHFSPLGNIDFHRPFHVVAKFALRPRSFMSTVKRHHPHGAVFHRQASRGVFPLYRRDGTDLQEAQPRPPEKTGKGLQAGAEYGIIAEDAARRGRRGTANREMYPSG